MKEHKHVVKSAVRVGIATTISRIFGYVRDVCLAIVLGAGFGMDAFTIAFRIANLFRRLVGEGAMSACFVPVFVHYQKDHSKEEIWDFVRKFLYTFLMILIGFALIIIIFSPFLIQIIAPGFDKIEGKTALTIFLNRLLAPYIVCIGLASFFMAILNSLKVFFIPATMPIFFNVSVIVSALVLSPLFKEPAVAIAIGALIGGVLQWVLQLPSLKKQGMSFKPTWDLYHPQTIETGKLLIPMLFGISIVQINLLVDSIFASFLVQGSVSSLYYSDRVMELVLGVFAISLATVTLPELSRAASEQDSKKARSVLSTSLRLILFIALPATIGLIALDKEIITTLFQYGKFSVSDAERTSITLLFFAIGLASISAAKVIIPAFYAYKNTKTPVWGAFLALVSNIIFILILIKPMRVGGIALATSLASFINLGFLLWHLEKKHFKLPYAEIWSSLKKITVCSLIMGVASTLIIQIVGFSPDEFIGKRIFSLLLAILVGVGAYLGSAYLLKVREIHELKELIVEKIRNKKPEARNKS